MITGEIKNKIDKIWLDIYAGGITQPLTVIEQLTYLMFIRSLDEKELENENLEILGEKGINKVFPVDEEGQSMRWHIFKDKDPREIFDIVSTKVFPYIKNLNDDEESAFSKYMKDALFLIPTPQLLQKIITGLDELYEHDIKNLDMQGDVYEYMLGKLATAGHNGQFRTPKHIRDMIVKLVEPTPKDNICDPACGTAGFLVSSAEYIREKYGDKMTSQQWDMFKSKTFSGYDTDRTMLRLSAMNLMLHSISNPNIKYADSVSNSNNEEDVYSLLLANPPFTGSVDTESINSNLKSICNTKKTELLFLALFIRMLKIGGRCACIVPDGVLFGTSRAHKSLKKELVENQQLQAVISMPSGVFKPYAGVSTAILLFTKTNAGGTDKVWFYDMESDGFTLDDKRTKLSDDGDITDIIERYHNLDKEADRKKSEKSFLVDKSEIVDNDYDLSINRYKEIEYKKIEYDKPEVIMDRLDNYALKLNSKMAELRELMKNG